MGDAFLILPYLRAAVKFFVGVDEVLAGYGFSKDVYGIVLDFFSTSLRGSYPTDYVGLWRWRSFFFYDASFLTQNSSLIIERVKCIALLNWNLRNGQ